MAIPDDYVRLYPTVLEIEEYEVQRFDVDSHTIRLINVSVNDSPIMVVAQQPGFTSHYILNHNLEAPAWGSTQVWGPGGSNPFARSDSYEDFLFVCTGAKIFCFRVLDGAVALLNQRAATANAVDCSYNGGYLFAGDGTRVWCLAVDSDGVMTITDSYNFSTETVVCVHANDDFIYVGTDADTVNVLSVSGAGQLSFEYANTGIDNPIDIVTDDGGYIYVAGYTTSNGGSKITGFSVNSGGVFTQIYQTPAYGSTPGGLAITDKLIFLANKTNGLLVFQHVNGSMSAPMTISTAASAEAVAAWQYFVYVSIGTSGVEVYYIDEIGSMDYRLLQTFSTIDSDWVTAVQDKAVSSDTTGLRLHLVELTSNPYLDNEVIFQPLEEGTYEEDLDYYLDTTQGLVSLSCYGECIERTRAALVPDSLSFGNVPIREESDPQTIQVLNSGDTLFNVLSVGIPDGFKITNEALPKELQSGIYEALDSYAEFGFSPTALIACGNYVVAVSDDYVKSYSIGDTGTPTEVDSYASIGTTDTEITGEYLDDYLFVCRGDDGLFVYSIDQDDGAITFLDSISVGSGETEGEARQIAKREVALWLANGSRGVDTFAFVGGSLVHLYNYATGMDEATGICLTDDNIFVAATDSTIWSIWAFEYSANLGEVGTVADELELEYHILDKLKISDNSTIVVSGTISGAHNLIYTVQFDGVLSVIDNLATGEAPFTYFDVVENSVFYGDYWDDTVYRADIADDKTIQMVNAAVGETSTVSYISVMDSGRIAALSVDTPDNFFNIVGTPPESYLELSVVFNPQDIGSYSKDAIVETDTSGSIYEAALYGVGLGFGEIDEYDLLLTHDMRWDQISLYFFDTMGYVQEVKDANPHIPLEIKMQKYVPIWTRIIKPTIEEESVFVTSVSEWRASVD